MDQQAELRRERWKLTAGLARALTAPTLVLSGLWTLLLVVEFTRGLTPASGFKRRGVGYLLVLTALVTVTGAAAMYQFELDTSGRSGFPDYGTALWWTAMLLTTMGSDYWPRTLEGRVLCLLLALYAFAVFGHVTAAIAAHFIGKDKAAGAA